jgi:hypothetical protein
MVEELARYGAMQRRSAFFRQLAKADLLLLDDFGLTPQSWTTVIDWSSRVSQCAATKPSPVNRPAHQKQKTIDPHPSSDRQFITASHPARHHPESWSGISRNDGPS